MRIKNSSYIKNTKKTVAVAMSMMMAGSMAACGSSDSAAVIDATDVQAAGEDEEMTEVIEKSLGLGTATDAEVDKEETVYLISNASGEVQDTIVDEWLKNPEGKDELADVSRLSDIENVKGDETFSQEGTKLTWQAGGSDIYYQGHTSEVAPVSVKATYYLDGKEIAPEDIAGKKGHVKIRYEYQNTAKKGDIYTPFIMATGMTLGMEDFVNVTAENAKVISDGSRYIVVGYGMPGLTESLGLDEEDIQLPDYFEVEADAVDFKLGMTITVASVETLGEEDIDLTDAEKEINDLAGEYQDGMDSLVEGISEYTNGVDKVNDGVDKLNSGSETLYSGAGALKSGMDSAASGTEDIKDGLNSAYSGSKSISDGASELNEAVQGIELPDVTKMAGGEVDDATKAAIKSTAESKLGTDTATYVGNAVTEVVGGSVNSETVRQVVDYNTSGRAAVQTAAQNAGKGQADAARDAASSAAGNASYSGSANFSNLKALKDQIAAALTPQYMTQYMADGTMDEATAANKAAATADATADAMVNGIYQAGYGDGYGNAYCTGYGEGYAAEYQNYLAEFDKYISQVTAGFGGDAFSGSVSNVANAYASAGSEVTLGKVGDAMDGFSTKLDTLKAGTSSLAAGTSQLTEGLSQLDTGAGALEGGMSQLKSGTDSLYSGTKALNDGVGTLKTGTNTLSKNSGALNDGSEELQSATNQLVDKLNEKEGAVNDFVDNVNSVKAAARDYQSFGGASGDMTTRTKFIIKIDGIDNNVE